MPAKFDASKFQEGLRNKSQKQLAAATAAMDVFGEEVIGDAQQLAPVKTGELQGSGTTDPAAFDGKQLTKVIGFNKTYAAPVHENLTAHHAVGQAKFLETPMRARSPEMLPFIAEKMKGAE